MLCRRLHITDYTSSPVHYGFGESLTMDVAHAGLKFVILMPLPPPPRFWKYMLLLLCQGLFHSFLIIILQKTNYDVEKESNLHKVNQ